MAENDLGAKYTYNQMFQSLDDNCHMYVTEMSKMSSTDVSGINEHDAKRMRSYFSAMTSKLDFIVGLSPRDLVETKGDQYPLKVIDDLPPMEDRSMYDLCVHMNTFRRELRRSSSTRMMEGMNEFDETRSRANLNRMVLYFEDYAMKTDPIDTPMTSPTEPTTGKGNRAVK